MFGLYVCSLAYWIGYKVRLNVDRSALFVLSVYLIVMALQVVQTFF